MHYAKDLRLLFDRERTQRDALAAARRDVRHLEETRTAFVSLISHELRTPITLMQGYLSLLMEYLPRDMAPPVRDFMTVIERETQQLATLINELTDFTRFQASREKDFSSDQESPASSVPDTGDFESNSFRSIHHLPFTERAPAEAIVAQAAARSAAAAARRNILIQTRVPPHLWLQYGEAQVVLILHHLIDNAVKFSPSGGRVLVVAREQQDEIVFQVRDDGPGIPDHLRREIFRPFNQQEEYLVRSQGGLGLGLALAERAAHALGGMISVHNAGEEKAGSDSVEPDSPPVGSEAVREVEAIAARTRGAVFTVRLPRRPAESLQERALRLSRELDQSRARMRDEIEAVANEAAADQAAAGEALETRQRQQERRQRERNTKDNLLHYARRLQETLNDERLRRQSLQEAYISSLQVLADAVEERGASRTGHSARVAHIASAIARVMGRSEEMIAPLILGAVLHDIGKVALPDAILLKSDHLTSEDWRRISTHPEIGARLLEDIPDLAPAIPVVRHHHERWDGTGYPYQLEGDRIPLDARIVALADAFDRMTSPRVYGEVLTIQAAIAEIERCSGTQFDPQIVQAFLRALRLRELNVSGDVHASSGDSPKSSAEQERQATELRALRDE
jgi:HD-GYP domain-containing protein (c-di-GMP phosphodiesterase class II)/signal transduction histidine kinase